MNVLILAICWIVSFFQTPSIDIKTYLSSGQHGNDPAKIKAMLEKMRNQKKEPLNQVKEDEDEEEVRPKDLFSKYKSGKSKGNRYGGSAGYISSSTEGPEDFTTTSHHHHNHNHKTWEPPGI